MRKIIIGLVGIWTVCLGLPGGIPAKGAPRYISLAPSTTEILFALGLDKEIVGVSSFCNYPEQAKHKERVGSFSQPNIEKIIALKPDYIFGTGLEQGMAFQKLKQLKFNTYVEDPANTRELLNSILEIGSITGTRHEAEVLVAKIKKEIDEISVKVNQVPKDKRPKVFFEFWNNPLMTAGKNSFIGELIELAGGINIAGGLNRQYLMVNPEEVIRQNPECIIVAYMVNDEPARELARRPGWDGIAAVKNKRVYADIDPDLMLRPGPRFAEAVRQLYKRLYQP
jgi:iron complex transport system substrate-binding protein